MRRRSLPRPQKLLRAGVEDQRLQPARFVTREPLHNTHEAPAVLPTKVEVTVGIAFAKPPSEEMPWRSLTFDKLRVVPS